MSTHSKTQNHGSAHHLVPVSVYIGVFTALLVLTGVTVLVASFDLGRLNDLVALAIAIIKASLVILFFMHIRYSPRLMWVVVAAGFFWLTIMIVLTMSDYLTRTFLAFPNYVGY
jgi:cytochrome c oxidase subunit IV